VYAVLGIVFYALLIGGAAVASNSSDSSPILGAGLGFTTLLFFAIMILLSYLLQAGIIRGALHITYGRPLDVKTFFQFDNLGAVIVASLLIGLLTGIGILLCVVPGIVFAFFAQFALYFVIDKGQSAPDAIRSSIALVNKNLGTVVLLFIAVYIAQAIGSALCGVGLLVALPVCVIATAFVYRRLLDEPVAP